VNKVLTSLVILILTALFLGSTATRPAAKAEPPQERPVDDIAFEEAQTSALLGVPLQKFPAPQGLTGMEEIPASARPFAFTLKSQPVSGSAPRVYYKERKIVKAAAPDGSTYEAYCGRDDDDTYEVAPDTRFVSTFQNRRQWYENHLGYGYLPANVYVGKREAGRIKPTLFFRDVGSHTTAPHSLAIDNRGMVHLAVADVNISQNNRLDLYWAIGDPNTGKWNAAWLVDRRGFTSWSYPWSAAWGDKVQLLWNWCDVSYYKDAPGMGVYHVEWSPKGFGSKTRIFPGPVRELDAAIEPQSGLLVIVLAKDRGGVYVLSRSAEGRWTRPSVLHRSLTGFVDVSITAAANGAFVIRSNSDMMSERSDSTNEWLLRPTQ
jgi:hypothetical protein